MNGNTTGILPTVELAGANNTYPAYPFMGGYGNGGFGFGGDGLWALILIAILFGNGGFGNWGGNANNVATTDFVSSQFTQNSLNDLSTQMCNGFANTNSTISNGFQNQSNLISSGFANMASSICDVKTGVLTGDMGLSNQILENRYANQLAECQTQRDILSQTNDISNLVGTTALQTQNALSNLALTQQASLDKCCCDIKELIRADGDETRALITQNTINDLREKLNEANTEISNRNIESSIINSVRPYPSPAWLVSSPYQSIYNGFGWNNGFYGNGFFGNTIV